MERYEVGIGGGSESEGVEEEETEDYHDGCEDAPPEFAIHSCFCGLLALVEVFHGGVERVERPDVEGCESAS